jgi:hypothetical protein
MQAIQSVLKSAEVRKAKALLAAASSHLVATQVAQREAAKKVDAAIAAGSNSFDLWLKKLPSQTQQESQVTIATKQ